MNEAGAAIVVCVLTLVVCIAVEPFKGDYRPGGSIDADRASRRATAVPSEPVSDPKGKPMPTPNAFTEPYRQAIGNYQGIEGPSVYVKRKGGNRTFTLQRESRPYWYRAAVSSQRNFERRRYENERLKINRRREQFYRKP